MLELPVLQEMSPYPQDLFKDGHVILKFNRSLNALDIPEGMITFACISEGVPVHQIFITRKQPCLTAW